MLASVVSDSLIPIVFLIYLAKKSGNFGSAAQLSKQLVQETLLDEGLRVVKEFNLEPSSPMTATESSVSLTTPSSTPTNTTTTSASCSSLEPSPIKSDAITSIMRRRLSPPVMYAQNAPRPRGRPPKAQLMVDRLEAAYHEKLTQHIHQTFLASHAYNQALAAANGYPPNRMMVSSNGQSTGTGLELMTPPSQESQEHMNNGRGNGYASYESTVLVDDSPTNLVLRPKIQTNGSDMGMVADLSVKQEQSHEENGCNVANTSD